MSSPQPEKRSRTRLYIIIGAVVLIVCCVCPLIYVLATGTMRSIGLLPTETPTPTHTLTPSPTNTPQPTNTPEPEPTPTPIPTDTPEPAPEGPPPEVVAYMLETIPKLQAVSDSLIELSELMTDLKFGDESWTIAVATNMFVIQETHKELTEMEVPPEMAEFHAGMLDATGDCSEAMDYLSTGIDNMNTEDVWTAVSLMNSGSEKLQKANKVLEEYMAQFE